MSKEFIDKYMPASINTLIGQEHIKHQILKLVEAEQLPHLLFEGGAGLGKTTLSNIIKLEHFKRVSQTVINRNYLYVDNHSMDNIKNEVIPFIKRSPSNNLYKKLCIIEEADRLSKEAQKALKEPMSKFAKNTIVILICNEAYNIIPALKSEGNSGGRCIQYTFRPAQLKQLTSRLFTICKKEGIEEPNKVDLIKIAKTSNGSPRTAIQLLQIYLVSNEIKSEEDVVYSVNPISLIVAAFNYDYKKCNEYANTLLYKDKINIVQMSKSMNKKLLATGIKNTPIHILAKVLCSINKLQHQSLNGVTPDVAIGGFIGELLLISKERKEFIKSDDGK